MAHYAMHPEDSAKDQKDIATREAGLTIPNIQAFAFTTIIWGCVFAGFLIRPFTAGRGLLAVVAFFGGLALLIGGMRESARQNVLFGAFFEVYGVFLLALAALVAPTFGIPTLVGGSLGAAIGLLFLTWTVFIAIYMVAAMKTTPVWLAVLGLLFLASLGVTLGGLTNTPVLSLIGGWIAIVCGLVSWYGMLSRLSEAGHSAVELPRGRMPQAQ